MGARHSSAWRLSWLVGVNVVALFGAAAVALYAPVHAQTISPRRLLEVVDISTPVVSADGTRVAFRVEQASIERNTYDTTWYVQDMDGNAPPRRVADGGAPLRETAGISLPAPAVWSPDGRWIYYRARLDDRIDIWRAAADGSGAEPLTRDPADVRAFSLSADGNTLFYSVGATREEVIEAELAEYDRGIRIDASVPIGQSLFRSGNIEGRLATQRYDGPWFGRTSLLADVPDRWKAVELATRERRPLAPSELPAGPPTASDLAEGLPEAWKLAAESGGERFALLTRVGEQGGFREKPDVELVMLSGPKTRRPLACTAELCTSKAITSVQWRPASDEVVFTITDPQAGLAQSIFRWNVRSGAVHPVVRTSGLIGGGRDRSSVCGLSADALACVAADADRPPRLERIDLETGQRQVLFDPNAALALDMAQVPVRLLRWTDANGQVFTGQLFPARTASDTPPPLFVTYYVCPGFLRGGLGDEWPLASLAELGISALCINDPPGYILDAEARYGRGLSAVQSVVDLLASEGAIDPDKVGGGGLSFGSEVAMWIAATSDVFAAVSVSSPVASPNYYLFGSLKGDIFFSGLMELWGLGSLDETPERWRLLSPLFGLEKIRAPILMQMPEQEYLAALDYAVPLMRDHRADLYVFPNAPHQKFEPRHKLAVYERNLDWFRFWLQGHEEAAPGKEQQYLAWRLMKAQFQR
ncbi:Atxe2 family lasso peptide isopeptidase [Phytopseudomonas dryadis]|uniref:Atxe2 family lasso peptide isopeptidase n=1 Tax=Phytopseudomonas dryadis TaxID=2487520 RepID=A0A4Q9QVX3_9GAMM|nr:Atxe2 family lasso peptide isopeptidase [Pseudomonas dryadis]TBU86940.1 Atxe2 family lasso peptide isopeptidase [Pseudomonas dryadis]